MENSSIFSLKNKSLGTSKRIKISRACDECRKRKVKCDGIQPCGRCKKSNAECIFAKLPPKRGPPKQYMENLEERLQRVEKALKSMTAPVRKLFDESMNKQYEVSNNHHSNQVITSLSDISHFTLNEFGQAVYVNPIPKNDYCQNDTLSDIASISDSPISSSNASFHHPSIIITSQQHCLSEAPIPDHLLAKDLIIEVQSLIEVYFDHVHKYVPMIHKPVFLKQFHTPSSTLSRLLIYAMCAVASRWTSDNISVVTNAIPSGYTYYRKALDLLDSFLDSPRTSTIQALILIVKYQEYIQRLGYHHRSYFYLGIAAQMCQDLGLSQLEGDSYDIEIKKRTFWVTFNYDLLLSIELGHKPYFDMHNCTTGFPLVTGEEGPALEDLITNQNIFIQLTKVLTDIYAMSRRTQLRQQLQGDNRTQEQVIEEQARLFSLHTHLENFLHEIPPSLIYSPTQDTENYPAEKQLMSDPYIGFLHMTYHFSVILLHRHYSLHALPTTQFDFVTYPHRRLCAVSASVITGIAEMMFEIFPKYVFHYPTRGIQHAVHCLTMAASIHQYEMTKGIEEATRTAARLQYYLTMDIIQTLANQSPSAEFACFQSKSLSIAEKRMSAPVHQLLPQPVMSNKQKSKNRRNTFSSIIGESALYQSSAAITDPAQLASLLNYHPAPNYMKYEQFMPPSWPLEQRQTYYNPMVSSSENMLPYDMMTKKQDYDTNYMMNDEDMLDANHQYDPTSGMSQLFLSDHQHQN